MRLSNDQRQSIVLAARRNLGEDAKIWLFGSRVDDAAKGGDVDVLVLSKKINLMTKLDILARLHNALGERKIDVAVFPDASRPFPRLVMQDAVLL